MPTVAELIARQLAALEAATVGVKSLITPVHNVKGYGAAGDGVADDTAAIEAAFQAAGPNSVIWFPPGTYLVDVERLRPLAGQKLLGAGIHATIIKNKGDQPGVVLYAPPQSGSIDQITIDGNNVPGVTGIKADGTNRPYQARWGHVRVINCPEVGIDFAVDHPSGSAFNYFGQLRLHTCGIGLRIRPVGEGWVNANWFDAVFVHFCSTGIEIENAGKGADGNTFGYAHSENCDVGFKILKAKAIVMLSGWLEGNNTNLILGDWPDVEQFTFWGRTDEDLMPATFQADRSILLPVDLGKHYLLGGQWHFERLRGTGSKREIQYPKLMGWCLVESTAADGDTTPDVTNVGILYLNNTKPTTITGLDRTLPAGISSMSGQVITLVDVKGNVTINNGGNFRLKANWTPAAGQTLTLFYSSWYNQWVELCRS